MNNRTSMLLLLAILAMATTAIAEKAPACKTTCSSSASCASASTVAWTTEEAKQIRVEVEEEDGVSKVKVYQMKDGEEVLVKEYETTGDPHEVLELDGGEGNVFIMRADDDGHAWTTHGDGEHVIKKIMKMKDGNAMFFGGPRAYLGIHMEDLSEQMAQYFDAEGVLVKEVVEDSPAAEAGLKAGDVIVKMGDEDIEDAGDISNFMSEREKGDEVEVKFSRKGKNKTVKVTLGEHEAQDYAFAFDGDNHFDVQGMPHMEHFAPHGGNHEVIMRRLHGGDSDEMENLRADIEELRAMLEELKENK